MASWFELSKDPDEQHSSEPEMTSMDQTVPSNDRAVEQAKRKHNTAFDETSDVNLARRLLGHAENSNPAAGAVAKAARAEHTRSGL
jgi:hypothetical protein